MQEAAEKLKRTLTKYYMSKHGLEVAVVRRIVVCPASTKVIVRQMGRYSRNQGLVNTLLRLTIWV
jgi:hypothetical protein